MQHFAMKFAAIGLARYTNSEGQEGRVESVVVGLRVFPKHLLVICYLLPCKAITTLESKNNLRMTIFHACLKGYFREVSKNNKKNK